MSSTRRSAFDFGWRVMLWLVMMALGIALCTGSAPPWRLIVGVLVLGLSIVHGTFLQHQAIHNTGFRSRRANEAFGVILGLPALLSFYEYRVSHFFHHANLGKPVHLQLYRVFKWQTDKHAKAQTFVVADQVKGFLPNLWRVLRGKPLEHFVYRYSRVQQIQFRRYYFICCACIALLFAISWLLHSWLPIAVWLAALICVVIPVQALLEFPEHMGCAQDTTDVSRNTRSTRSNRLMQWFVHFDNLHAEHHLEPHTPFHLLPSVRPRLEGALEEAARGYVSFYIDYFRRIRPMVMRHYIQQ